MRLLLAVLTALIPTLASARPMEMAAFRKLFRRDRELSESKGKDNAHECTRTVRHAVKKASSSWGAFHYTCEDGVARIIFVGLDSKINQNPSEFVSQNLGLFDLEGSSTTVTFDGHQGTQRINSMPIINGGIYRVEHQDGKQMVYNFQILDSEISSMAIDTEKMKKEEKK